MQAGHVLGCDRDQHMWHLWMDKLKTAWDGLTNFIEIGTIVDEQYGWDRYYMLLGQTGGQRIGSTSITVKNFATICIQELFHSFLFIIYCSSGALSGKSYNKGQIGVSASEAFERWYGHSEKYDSFNIRGHSITGLYHPRLISQFHVISSYFCMHIHFLDKRWCQLALAL